MVCLVPTGGDQGSIQRVGAPGISPPPQVLFGNFVPDCVRSDLRGSKFKIFTGGGGDMPQTPLVTTHAYACYHPVFFPTQNPVWNPGDQNICTLHTFGSFCVSVVWCFNKVSNRASIDACLYQSVCVFTWDVSVWLCDNLFEPQVARCLCRKQ